jgi:hypothetical protein
VDGGRLVPAAGRVHGFVVVASSGVAGFNGSVLCLRDFVQAPCAPQVEGWRVHVNRDTMALLRFDIDLGATHSLTVVSLVDFDNRDPFPADQAVTWMTPGWTPPTDNGCAIPGKKSSQVVRARCDPSSLKVGSMKLFAASRGGDRIRSMRLGSIRTRR